MVSTCHLSADDCILYRQIIETHTDSITLQNDLLTLEKWEKKKWKMKLNIDKCMVLTVTLKNNPIKVQYTLHNHRLASVTSAKYLRVTIDSKLQ